jgi:hypothetical protein
LLCVAPEDPYSPEDGVWEYLDSHVGYRHIVYGLVLKGYDPPVLSLEMLRYTPANEQPYPVDTWFCEATVGDWVPAAA